ncbi:MAG: hypothetical protein HQ508_00690 [Candidatus Marinimicrobia bacterium]|nr:hypothetical protein [Candidatus Neomarinimicrobiota bacterium]
MKTAKLKEIVEDYFTDLLRNDEASRYDRDPVDWSGGPDTVTGLEYYETDCREMLASGDYSTIKEDLQRYLNKHGWAHRIDDFSKTIVAREMMKAYIRGINVAIRRERGDYSQEAICQWIPETTQAFKDSGKPIEPPAGLNRKAGRKKSETADIIREEYHRQKVLGVWDEATSKEAISDQLSYWLEKEHLKKRKADTIRRDLKAELSELFNDRD